MSSAANVWIGLVLIACVASVTILVALGKLDGGTEEVVVGVILGHVGTLSSVTAARRLGAGSVGSQP